MGMSPLDAAVNAAALYTIYCLSASIPLGFLPTNGFTTAIWGAGEWCSNVLAPSITRTSEWLLPPLKATAGKVYALWENMIDALDNIVREKLLPAGPCLGVSETLCFHPLKMIWNRIPKVVTVLIGVGISLRLLSWTYSAGRYAYSQLLFNQKKPDITKPSSQDVVQIKKADLLSLLQTMSEVEGQIRLWKKTDSSAYPITLLEQLSDVSSVRQKLSALA